MSNVWTEIIVTGNPVEGFTFIGPFDEVTDEDTDKIEGDWWIAHLYSPEA